MPVSDKDKTCTPRSYGSNTEKFATLCVVIGLVTMTVVTLPSYNTFRGVPDKLASNRPPERRTQRTKNGTGIRLRI